MKTQRTIEINALAEVLWVLLTEIDQLQRYIICMGNYKINGVLNDRLFAGLIH